MRVIIDPGVLQKLTVEGATILLVEIGVTVPQVANLILMVPEISDQQLQGQVKVLLQGQDQEKEQKGRPFRSERREAPRKLLCTTNKKNYVLIMSFQQGVDWRI